MSVLIKGMDMPETCNRCRLCTITVRNRTAVAACGITGGRKRLSTAGKQNMVVFERPNWCPLCDAEIYETSLHAELLRHGELVDSHGTRYECGMDEDIKG